MGIEGGAGGGGDGGDVGSSAGSLIISRGVSELHIQYYCCTIRVQITVLQYSTVYSCSKSDLGT